MKAEIIGSTVRVSYDVLDLAVAVKYAEIRMISSAASNLTDSTTYQRDTRTKLTEELTGVLGEMAICYLLNTGGPKANTFHLIADAGVDIECRSTTRADGRLIFRKNDDPSRRFVLAIVFRDRVDLVGWIYGKDAMVDQWKVNPNGYREAWFVPRSSLRPMNELSIASRQNC